MICLSTLFSSLSSDVVNLRCCATSSNAYTFDSKVCFVILFSKYLFTESDRCRTFRLKFPVEKRRKVYCLIF